MNERHYEILNLVEQEGLVTIQLAAGASFWDGFINHSIKSINPQVNNELVLLQFALFQKIKQVIEDDHQTISCDFIEMTLLYDYADMYECYLLVEAEMLHSIQKMNEINEFVRLLKKQLLERQTLYEAVVDYVISLERGDSLNETL